MRIAFVVEGSPEAHTPRVSLITADVVARLEAKGVWVDLLVPEARPLDIADVRPLHDLYVLKSKSSCSLSLAGIMTAAGARAVNTVQACNLARDKIASAALLAAAGVPVPPSWATSDASHLVPLLDGGPIWVKPQRGSRGVGVRRVGDPTELNGHTAPSDPYGLPLPFFVQREVPSTGWDLKVYVVGTRLCAITRPFPARTLQEKLGTPAIVPPEVRAAAIACGHALGLELYGVDFMLAGDRFFAVDVNAFPGYKGATGAARYVAEYLYQRASRPHARPV